MRDDYLLAELTSNGYWHVWPTGLRYLVDGPDVRVRAAIQGASSLEEAIRTVLSMMDKAVLSSSSWRQDADLWHEIRYSVHSEYMTVAAAQERAERIIASAEDKEDVFDGNYYAIHAYEDELHLWKMARCRAKLYIADNFGDNEATFICKLPNQHGGLHGYWFNRGRDKNVFTTWQHDEFFEGWIDQVNMDLDRDLEQMSEADHDRICVMREDGTVPCAYRDEDKEKVAAGTWKTTKNLMESTCYFCRQFA